MPESEKEVSFSKSADAQFRGGAKILKTTYGNHVYWKLLRELLALYARPTDGLVELLEKKSKEYKRRTAESCAEIDATVQARGLVHDPEVLSSIDARLVALRTTRDNIEVERLEFGKRVFTAFCAIDAASEAMTAKVLELCKLVEDAHALLQAGCVITPGNYKAEMRARQAVANLIMSGVDPKVIEAVEQVRAYFKPTTAEPADSTRLRVATDTATAGDLDEREAASAAKPDTAKR